MGFSDEESDDTVLGVALIAGDLPALVAAARAGDESAFADLVRRHQDAAVAYARSILGDEHLAEDVAQEAFVDAYRHLEDLKDPGAFAAWLRTIVFKHCDRRTRRRLPALVPLENATGAASGRSTPLEQVEAADVRAAVRSAIDRLGETEREAVLLYYMGDRSHAEIADFLEITPNAVKTRLYSARKRLKAHFTETRMAELEDRLGAERPSRDSRFADTVQRMIRPQALAHDEQLVWSPGMASDVWDLFCATIGGDIDRMRALLDRDPALIRAQYEYHTPLAFAVRENQVEAAAFLLDRGALPTGDPVQTARDRGFADMERMLVEKLAEAANVSPDGERMAEAIRERDAARVRALLDERPGRVEAADRRGNRPIHWATMTRQPDLIDLLADRGADLDTARLDGARPIQLTNGDYHYRGWRDVPSSATATPREVLDQLRTRGAEVDLCTASYIGDLERVREVLRDDPDAANRASPYISWYACSGTPLRNAAQAGHREIVELLLEHGADPNLPEEHIAPMGHALHAAAGAGHYEIVELLLSRGARPNIEVESSADTLSAVLNKGDERMARLLASHGAARRVTLLAYYDDLVAAAAVFDADPSLADDEEALGYAASEDFVRLMLLHQPDLPRRVTVLQTPEISRMLLDRGMDPNRPDWLRVTPLHRLAGKGDVATARVFLDHGADPDAIDLNHRSTPLGWAAGEGHAEMVALLIERGAKADRPREPVWARPIEWARRRGHDAVVRVLRDVLERR